MDKKILLGGAAALLLVGNMYATPANAAIDLTIGGEAKLTAAMSECGPAAGTVTLKAMWDDVSAAALTDAKATADDEIAAINPGLTTGDDDLDENASDTTLATAAGPCEGDDRSGIDWGFGKKTNNWCFRYAS